MAGGGTADGKRHADAATRQCRGEARGGPGPHQGGSSRQCRKSGRTGAGRARRAALHGRGEGAPPRHGVGPRSEEHTSELQSLMRSSYAVFCLKTKKINTNSTHVLSPPQQTKHKATLQMKVTKDRRIK